MGCCRPRRRADAKSFSTSRTSRLWRLRDHWFQNHGALRGMITCGSTGWAGSSGRLRRQARRAPKIRQPRTTPCATSRAGSIATLRLLTRELCGQRAISSASATCGAGCARLARRPGAHDEFTQHRAWATVRCRSVCRASDRHARRLTPAPTRPGAWPTRHDVVLIVVRECQKQIGLFDALVAQKVLIGGIAMQNQNLRRQHRCQLHTAARVLDDLHVKARPATWPSWRASRKLRPPPSTPA